jgi:hypothetical protein
MGSALTALPWYCIAPAAFAVSGVATAGIGTELQSAMPVFLVLSAGLLGRSVYLALVKRQGAPWVRAVVLVSAPAIALVWAFRFGWM